MQPCPSNRRHLYIWRYILRSTLNTLGSCVVTAFYLFIVCVYLLRPSVNDIIPYYPVNARGVFYAWLILSVFVLDWAKSGLAGFEASALMKPALAPKTALQLIWHADRAWGSVSGWWKAVIALYGDLSHSSSQRREQRTSRGPAPLWWYLSLSSFILYAAIPLAGLSMDPKDALQFSRRKILISGPNETSFETGSSNGVAEVANSRWRQGNPTTAQGDTILYAPQGTKNVSTTYYNDVIEEIYLNDLNHNSTVTGPLSFFSGPQVSERAQGKAWGLLTNLTCSVVHPYDDLELLKVKSINNWTVPRWGISSSEYNRVRNSTNSHSPQFMAGLNPALFYDGDLSFGVQYKYLIAGSSRLEDYSNYINSSDLPHHGSLELFMWQGYEAPSAPDSIFANLSSHPLVVSSTWPNDNTTYLGYAIRCSVNSTVGFANLDAATRSYSNFKQNAFSSKNTQSLGAIRLNEYPGILAIQSLVYGSFTTAILNFAGPPVCQPGDSATCNSWYAANAATGGVPLLIPSVDNPRANNFQYPTISPERMKLAMYKLFGEVVITMMASGPGSWTGELHGLDAASELIPGRVPWRVVIVLLSMWTFITVLPNCWTFMDRRWAAILDGFEMFRLGAEWREAVWKHEKRDFTECDALINVPGMVGDMEPGSEKGFVGLSAVVARARGRVYVHDRGALGAS
ncbi:hypothetical protein MMC16_004738 [Acarospora aff. strigata]|nr:hypothetical protein [Acarospora aff. strigata]